jgi:type IV secretion system protein TrbI
MSDQKEDPGRLALRAAPKPVTRLNRRTLVIAGAIVGTGLLGVALWSLQPTKPKQQESKGPELHQAQKVSPAEGLNSLPRDYSSLPKSTNQTPSTVPQLGAPLGELGRPVLRAEQEAGLEPLAQRNSFELNPHEDAVRVDRLRRVQEDDAAAKAQVFFQLRNRQASTAPAEPPSPTEAAMDRMLKLLPNAVAAGAASEGGQPDEAATQNGQNGKQSFVKGEADPKIYGSGTLQNPKSPYQVMAGTVIPAALVTGINSDLPGQMIATVTENIYDTVTGYFLLVPQGARLLGQYDSQVAYGQRRVLLVWTRLLLPDGSSIVLDRLPGVDAAGQAGLEDKVNWHWGRIFQGAALSTLIGVGAELASPAREGNGNAVVASGRESIQSTVTDVGQQITKRNLNIQPTLTVRAGFPVNVIVNKDIVLRPFQSPATNARVP